jgi:hypothetical protein
VCVEPWAWGRWGAAPAPLDLRDLFPASDRRPETARAPTRAQPSCSAAHPRSGCDRASPTRLANAPRVAAWPTARPFADAWPPNPLPTAPRAAPAARACPFPASRAPARPSASPGMALAHGVRRWRWRWSLVGHFFFMADPRSAKDFCVYRSRISLFWFSAPRSARNYRGPWRQSVSTVKKVTFKNLTFMT